MTPKIIELKQAPVVLVEINESYAYPDTIGIGAGQTYTSVMELNTGNCIHIGTDLINFGFLSDLTEEQFKSIVDSDNWHFTDKTHDLAFRDYKVKSEFDKPNRLKSAKDSFYSFLESEKVYMENPYGVAYKRMPESDMDYRSFLKWQEAQSRTIDPKRTVVLLRKESQK